MACSYNQILCSDIASCEDVLNCVNVDLNRQLTDQEFVLDKFCPLAVSCIDAQFENIASNLSNNLDHFGSAIDVILKSFPGYSSSGEFFFSVNNGTVEWSNMLPGATTVTGDHGILVTGSGPYNVEIVDSFVRGLFNFTNGLTYNSITGGAKLGGLLTENTIIDGGAPTYSLTIQDLLSLNTTGAYTKFNSNLAGLNTFLELDPPNQKISLKLDKTSDVFSLVLDGMVGATLSSSTSLILQDGGTSRFKIAGYGAANVGDILTLNNTTTGAVVWTTPVTPGGTYTDEDAQDAIGNILLDSATIDFTYLDGVPRISAQVIDDSITFSKMQNVTSDRILGRDTVGSGNTEELIVSGGLEFSGSGGIQTAAFTGDVTKAAGSTVTTIAADAVTDTKLRDSVGFSVIGKSTTGTGNPADITAGVDETLRRSGSGDLLFGTLVTNNIGNDQVTFAKVQNISSSRLLGRTTPGSGDVESLTVGSHLLLTAGSLNAYGRTLIGISTFTANDTWGKPAGCNAVVVYTVAGGGGGGGALGAGAQAAVGAGGGAGGYSINYIQSGLGATETIAIGAGGAGGDSGTSTPYQGEDGGNTSFGAHITAFGGAGGETLATGTSIAKAVGGVGGAPSVSTGTTIITTSGENGDEGIRLSASVATFSKGGSSLFGAAYNGGVTGPGAGGYGNIETGTSVGVSGYDGGDGIVIVYEYS